MDLPTITLEAATIAAHGCLSAELANTIQTHSHLEVMTNQLVLQISAEVYRERLLEDLKTFPWAAVIDWDRTVTVHTPGPRIWWAPWRRRPDKPHHIHIRGNKPISGTVPIEARYYASFPDLKNYPAKLGHPVRVVELNMPQDPDWSWKEG